MRKLLVLLLFVLLAAGCGGHKSVLDEGIRPGISGKTYVIGPAQARRSALSINAAWERELRIRARRDPRTRFPNLSPTELRRRLDQAAKALGFEVVSFELLHPRQLAPRIVVRTTHYLQLARATNGLLRKLDPKQRTRDDRTGWLYEGFYFKAEDEHGIPFLIVHNYWRGGGGGGGQWARSERLYPFDHG